MMSERRSPLHGPAFLVSVLCCAGYFLIARVVLNLFPFSTYSMYASSGSSDGSDVVRGCHLLAIEPDGRSSDVSEYRAWDCPPWEDAARRSILELSCPGHFNVEDQISEYMRRNKGPDPAAKPVSLSRRVWTFKKGQVPTVSDHLIVSCRAVRR